MAQNADSPVSKALRAEGYVPLPRLWVKKADMPQIQEIAFKHSQEVNSIRHKVKNQDPANTPRKDPAEDKEAAWEQFEQMRSKG